MDVISSWAKKSLLVTATPSHSKADIFMDMNLPHPVGDRD